MTLKIKTPFPPSVNNYWGNRKGSRQKYLKKEGKAYRKSVVSSLLNFNNTIEGPVRVLIHATMPDNLVRDIDNLLKAPLDALSHARVYIDDVQVVELTITKHPPDGNGGHLIILVEEAV